MISNAAEQTCAYTPPRYPAYLVTSRRLADNTTVIIRPIRPEDDAMEKAFIGGLSSNTRNNRLLSGRKLTPDEI